MRHQATESPLVDHDNVVFDKIRLYAPQCPWTRPSSPDCTVSTMGFRSARRIWWTPSESMTVPSAKTWRNMPNWLPSLERPSASRVRTGSADVTAELTCAGLGRDAAPSVRPRSARKEGDSGQPAAIGEGQAPWRPNPPAAGTFRPTRHRAKSPVGPHPAGPDSKRPEHPRNGRSGPVSPCRLPTPQSGPGPPGEDPRQGHTS